MPYNSQIDERKERMKRSCVEDIYSIRKIYMRKVFQKWWWKMKLSLKAQTMRKQNCIPFNDCNINNFNSLHTHIAYNDIVFPLIFRSFQAIPSTHTSTLACFIQKKFFFFILNVFIVKVECFYWKNEEKTQFL